MKKIKWVIAHEPIDLFLKVADSFMAEVKEKAGDIIDVEVLSLTDYAKKYNDGKKVTKDDLIRMVDTGEIEMSHIYTTWLADYNKDLHALDLPFIFKDHDHADKVLEGDIGNQLLQGVANNSNIKAMSFTYSGGYRIVPSNFKAETVDDWKGKTLRTSRSPVAIDTFKLLGAESRGEIALEEMNSYADRGEIDAGESTYVRVFPLKQNESFKYINDTAHSLFLTSIIVNKDTFASFSEDEQRILSDAAFNAARKERRESVEQVAEILDECNAKGHEVVTMSEDELEKFKEITKPVYDMYKDYFSPGLVNSIQRLH